jgi:hypothetical protein
VAQGHGRRFHNRAAFIFPDSQLRCLLRNLVFHVPTPEDTNRAGGCFEDIERSLGGSRSAMPIREHQPLLLIAVLGSSPPRGFPHIRLSLSRKRCQPSLTALSSMTLLLRASLQPARVARIGRYAGEHS